MKHIKALTTVDPKMAATNGAKCDTILKTPEEKDAKKAEKQNPTT